MTISIVVLYLIIGALVSVKILTNLLNVIFFEGYDDYLMAGTHIVVGTMLLWPAVLVLLLVQEYYQYRASQEDDDESEGGVPSEISEGTPESTTETG